MAEYEVWTSNEATRWTICHLETDDRQQARAKAQQLLDSKQFLYVAMDRNKKTIWTNDPDTDVVKDDYPYA